MSGPASNVLPGSGVPFGGVERYAIVGERTERLALQGTRVIETTARSVVLANALTIGASNVADLTATGTMTVPVAATAVKRLSLFVEYTSGMAGGRPVIFPMFSIGQVEHGFTDFVLLETFADQVKAGPFVFVSQQSDGMGPFSLAPFSPPTIQAVAAAEVRRAVIPIDFDDLGIPACAFVKFQLVDAAITPGTCTIIATVK